MRQPIKNKEIEKMTRAEFEALPCRGFDEDIGKFRSLVILPARDCQDDFDNDDELAEVVVKRMEGEQNHLHDSGYRCLSFVACIGSHPICRVGGGCDIVHINGIGGYGQNWTEGNKGVPKHMPPVGWSLDCLPKSGLMRLFANEHELVLGLDVSSFEVFSKRKKKDEE